jgi:hypothetical protein
MNMKNKLMELITRLDPELKMIVAEVIEKEREYLDMLKPRGVKQDIKDIIDKYARYGLGKEN